MSRIPQLTASFLAVFLLGTSLTGLAQVQEKIKPRAATPKAAPKPGAAKPSATKTGAKDKSKPTPAVKPIPDDDSVAKKSAKEDSDAEGEAAVRQSAEAFVEAYNNHDAKAVAALFAEKAEVVDEEGNLSKGREAIEQNFAQTFEEFPEGKISLEIASIRMLSPNIALEEGLAIGTPVPDGPEVLTNYTAIHVKVDSGWKLASVSDADASGEQLTPHDHLEQLSWMVGDWMDESADAIIKSSCDWDATGNYLLQEFAVQISGSVSSSGSIRIGWDPLTRQLKSWVFSADGGHSEGLWTHIGDEWVVHLSGVNADGDATSATSVYRYLDDDTMSWRSYDRTIGGEPVDEIPENVIKRHPPAPDVEAAATEPAK